MYSKQAECDRQTTGSAVEAAPVRNCWASPPRSAAAAAEQADKQEELVLTAAFPVARQTPLWSRRNPSLAVAHAHASQSITKARH